MSKKLVRNLVKKELKKFCRTEELAEICAEDDQKQTPIEKVMKEQSAESRKYSHVVFQKLILLSDKHFLGEKTVALCSFIAERN